MSKKKFPIVLSKEKLEIKSTKELLAQLKKLHQCEETFELTDMDSNPDVIDTDTIYFKQTQKWITAYTIVKSILSTREHDEK